MSQNFIKSLRGIAALAYVTLIFFAAASAQTQTRIDTGSLEQLNVPAPSLAGNLLGDPALQQVFVYLPPTYRKDATKRYATLYLLHGYTSRPEAWVKGGYQGMTLSEQMDLLIAKGVAAEMIVVVPNGRNAYLGSFYTNSPVTGNWEDYIFRDVVGYIDSHYRSIARAGGRGIAGHSMGGYGAFMLAMKHPDIFGAVYALSPCCVGFEGDITADNPVWKKAAKVTTRDVFSKRLQSFDDFWMNAMIAVSAAFSPNREKAPIYADFPFVEKDGSLVRNETAFSSYREKMPLYLVEQYRSNLLKLRGISLDVGEFDEFSHIRRATAGLSAELSEREIPHSFEIYENGDHGNKITERFVTKVVPFFSAILEK